MGFSTILLVFFMIIFWLFRAVVAVCAQYSIDLIGIVPYNLTLEIIISFLVIICIVLIKKKKTIGAIAYILIYGFYFGSHLFSGLISLFQGGTLSMDMSINLICDFCAILLALFCLFDNLLSNTKKSDSKHRSTDWYFNNEEYDKKIDSDNRDDKNQYKFY